jgi:hypothetical protein
VTRRKHSNGSPDLRLCPSDPSHGHLLAIPGVAGLYCPHQTHDGRPAYAGHEQVSPSQNRWMLDDPELQEEAT